MIAKSNIILDVKPWDDETDMKIMETEVRKIETDGLLWGAGKCNDLFNHNFAYSIFSLYIKQFMYYHKLIKYLLLYFFSQACAACFWYS